MNDNVKHRNINAPELQLEKKAMTLDKTISEIERVPVGEQVARQLLALVQNGSLEPGQKLPPERELSTMLKVSRPSLREALRALSLLGVLNIRQGGGVYVSALDPESLLAPLHFFVSLNDKNLDDLFEARLVIEAENARIAAEKISDEDIARLKKCVDFEAHELNDQDKFIQSDVEFHNIINQSVDNAFLNRFATSLHILGKASREITGHIPGVIEQSLKDHEAIVAAIDARDGEAAAKAMKTHLVNVREALKRGQLQS
ncbi:MAG: FadR family transcriptional regulator [Proteobacteria bacterium]|nr:FadR family transcriptional regulator [Pseudomonadota bacterium]